MLWLRILVWLLTLAAVVCGCYDFHLHLHNATQEEVIDATMLTLLFGMLAGVSGFMVARLSHKD